jgi:hypothetical protein
MKYLFDTNIDCKACLDDVLLGLLNNPNIKTIHYQLPNKFILDGSLSADNLLKLLPTLTQVTHDFTNNRQLTDQEYTDFTNTFSPYTKSLI